MLNFSLLQGILTIAIACSSITVIFVQKTKRFCSNSKQVPIYSLIVNIIIGFLFSRTFSNISYINSIWVGLFSYLGADTIYKGLEGNISSYSDLVLDDNSNIDKNNVGDDNVNIKNDTVDNNEIVGEITYE